MFPIRDSAPRRGFPIINLLIIAANVVVFLIQLLAPDFERFVFQYGFVPARFDLFDPTTYSPLLFSIFMHGGFMHIISNMWFLHIFGDNVEDELGHFGFLLFYLAGGIIAIFGQYIFSPNSNIPMIGASGAVSAVAGAYFVRFRRHTIEALVPTFVGFWDVIELPAWFFLGYWFVIQVFSGLGSLVAFDINQGGVAWFAHIAGFVFGYAITKRPRQSYLA